MEGSVPNSILNFTPRDSNPKLLPTANIMVASDAEVSTSKAKPETSPPIKTAPGAKDFTKAGLYHCKVGTPILDFSPSDLGKKYCSFFCLHGKKCSKPAQVC